MKKSIKNKKWVRYLKRNYLIYLILIVYIVLITIMIFKHEPWADEAQAWLLARDSGLYDLLFKTLRYDGHPGLWHLILMIPSKLGLPYIFLNITSGIIATLGVYIFLRYSPFPKIIKVLLPFSYFIFYQYAVIARNYVLLPILLFLIAKIYKNKTKKIYLFIFLIILLANTHALGFVIAIVLLFIHLIDLFKEWPYLNKNLKQRQIKSYLVSLFFIIIEILQMLPPSDSNFAVGYNFHLLNFFDKSYLIIDETITLFLFLISFLWFFRQRVLSLFLLLSSSIFFFSAIKYYNVWHQGSLFLIFLFVLWISFENQHKERKINPKFHNILEKLMILFFVILLLFQISWSITASINDFNGPYSPGKAIAEYIKENNFENKKIYATSFWSTSIQPYFAKNIFDNYNNKKNPAFWLWSYNINMIQDTSIIIKHKPDLIISREPINLKRLKGYQFIGLFEGNMYWKRAIKERNNFYLYQKEGIE